eukprot:363561-Chlamydomonas_euryale.AAC.6
MPHGAWSANHSTQTNQSFSKQQLLNHRPIRHPGPVLDASEPGRVEDSSCTSDVYELGAHLPCALI